MSTVHLRLEFAAQAHRTSPTSLALLLAGVLLFTGSVLLFGLTLAENDRQARQLAAMEVSRKTVAPAPSPRADPAELSRVQFVRQTSRSLMTPWADLLAALEAAPTNVALLSVEPSATKRSISLTAEAANPADMLNYLQALQRDHRLTGVLLTSHQVQVQAPGTPIRFQVQARWGGVP
jgi:hypothetical protein